MGARLPCQFITTQSTGEPTVWAVSSSIAGPAERMVADHIGAIVEVADVLFGVVRIDQFRPGHEERPEWLGCKFAGLGQRITLTDGDWLPACGGDHCIVLALRVALFV